MKKVVTGSDHGGFKLKERIKKHLEKKGYNVTDTGIYNENSAHYPEIAEKACREFLKGDYEFGILFCGTGIGISISANKIKGIRCALINDIYTAKMCKAHNNVNFLSFGGRVEYKEASVEEMIDKYIETEFEGGRHQTRIEMITALEQDNMAVT